MSEREDEQPGIGELAYMLLPAYFVVITHREIVMRKTQGTPMSRFDKAREYGISLAGEIVKNGVYGYLATHYLL